MAEVRKYSDRLYVLEHSAAYRKEVEKRLDLIGTTKTGKALFDAINANAHWILIVPFKPTKKNPVNAAASAKDDLGSRAVGTTRNWEFELPGGIKFTVPLIGTGAGSDSWVEYHPATWTERAKRTKRIDPGAGPAEILYHELVHSMRHLYGIRRTDPVPGYPALTNISEFYSVLAANVYRGERGFTEFRTDHDGFIKLDKIMKNSENYYDEFKGPIDLWFKDQQKYCLAMARVSTTFNPFREAAIALALMTRPGVPMALPARHP